MNLLLMKGGYPPLVIRPEDRLAYIEALEHYQLTNEQAAYNRLMLERLEASLDDYLDFLQPNDEG